MSFAANPARPRLASVAAAVLLVAFLGVQPAAAAPDARTRELEQKRREVEKKKAAAAAEIDVLRASDEKLEIALSALNANVDAQEAKVAAARQAAAVAVADAARLRGEEERTKERLRVLRGQLKNVAVDAYIHGPSDAFEAALGAKDLQEASKRQQMLEVVGSTQTELADELQAAEEDVVLQRSAAEGAAQKAEGRKSAVEARLADLKVDLDSQQRVAGDLEDRLDARLGEAEALASLDQQVSAQIKARQAQLARLVAARPAPARASRAAARVTSAPGGLASVRGITVAASLAPQLAALLDAADADGFSFGGGGYRDPQARSRPAGPTAGRPPTTSTRSPRPSATHRRRGREHRCTSRGSPST